MNQQEIKTYVNMLKSPDPAQRRTAIIALGKSGDQRALKPLAYIHKNDPDDSLRKLALKAGRNIQKKATQTDDAAYSYDEPPQQEEEQLSFIASADSSKKDDVPDWMNKMAGEAPPPREVTAKDRRRAQALKDRAFDESLHGNAEKVVELLAEAIDLDPAVARDSMAVGLLAQATGLDGDTAVKEIQRINAEDRAKGKKRKSSSGLDWSETIDFFAEIGIWFIVIGLIMSGLMFAFFQTVDFDASTTTADGTTASPDDEFNQQIEDFYDDYGAVFSLMFGFGYGAFVSIGAIFLSFVAWWVGLTFMGGQGLLYPFLKAMMRATVILLALSIGINVFFTLFQSDLFSFSPGLYLVAIGISTVLPILILAWQIGKAHEFGMMMGCANMMGTVFACGMMPTCCSMVLAFGNI